MPDEHHLIVTGDVLIDRHLYTGERATPTTRDRRGVLEKCELGGAYLLHRLIARLFALDTQRLSREGQLPWKAELAVVPPPHIARPTGRHGYAVWQPYPMRKDKPDDPAKVWRASQLMGYGDDIAGLHAAKACDVSAPNLLVIDDAGFLFRDSSSHASWALAERGEASVLLKMSEPLAQGALWDKLIERCAHRLICLVAAADLRRETLALSEGLSWEATLDDLWLALRDHPVAHRLLACRHLVVTFSSDAALWLDLTDPAAPLAHLCADPTRAEGEWEAQFPGEAFGFNTAMAAALALELTVPADAARIGSATIDLRPAMEAGLLAMRDLKQYGHGKFGDPDPPPTGYPIDRVAAKIGAARDGQIDKQERLAGIEIAWRRDTLVSDPPWSVVEVSQRPARSEKRQPRLDLAWDVALRGTNALEGLPNAHFGDLLTADRSEIETLRYIRQRMVAYREDPKPKRPLSIGVFGPPGAGKSFGVKQLAVEVFKKESWREFNLSQFQDSSDLNAAFHQVRDMVVDGLTPVVLWDEFDSRKLFWLQFLLAPMQDGRFQDHHLNHAVGKCVFVFAGGTSWSFAEFAPPDEKQDDFKLSKGPDFVSRLDAHFDVLGPNPRERLSVPGGRTDDPKDLGYRLRRALQDVLGAIPPGTIETGGRTVDSKDLDYRLRRALLIRGFLKCKAAETVDFDPYLLHALLSVKKYIHGARSLEKLIQSLRGGVPLVVRGSNLPRPEQLKMYVEVEEFNRLIHGDATEITRLLQDEKVAAAIHETWRALSQKKQGRLDRPYAELTEVDKEDNRAAARRMPQLLALAGLALRRAGDEPQPPLTETKGRDEPEPPLTETEVREAIKKNLEKMAEAEHIGWMEHRKRNGWQYDSERNDARKRHPSMRPYAELLETEKNKDRDSILEYQKFAARAECRIVRAPPPHTE
jgi:hypothetical protein